ncbi:hypothetical protein ACE7GA_24715 [Roseomonas sp. CCTCC AB2023176]|uniref:hypothetical protein n=1 Tax=Roseomonas sp. CCTCC AB2023176 TaxID=3342640 RepID=UPI0035E2FAA8
MIARRGVLAVAVAAPAAAQGVAVDWPALGRRALAPIRAAVAAADGPPLLKSFVTDGGEAFDLTHAEVAYTYDNALAGLALLAGGDRAGAERIGTALALVQDQDRHWRDGRLRNAYAAGRVFAEAPRSARPPGWWDARGGQWIEDGYAAGAAAGPVAFCVLLWTALGPRFAVPAARAADWLETLRGPHGFRGGFVGHEPNPAALTWISTEQNLDLSIAFARLGRTLAAAHAAALVRSLWLPAEGRFAVGLRPDGSINGDSGLDANLWPLLTWPGETAFAPALDWALSRHGLPAGAAATELDGVDFDLDRDGIWMEGTAQAVLLLRRRGREANAARFASTLARHTRTDGWITAASVPWLTTGLETGVTPGVADFRYPARGHLAANAWAALAGFGVSPFDPS